MKRIGLSFALCGALAFGCSGKSATPSSACDHVAELAMRSALKAEEEKPSKEEAAAFKKGVREGCKQKLAALEKELGKEVLDKVVACVVKAKSEEALDECRPEKLAKGGKGGKMAAKGKTSEAREFVKKIYDGARAYYMDPNFKSASIGASIMPPMFPGPSVGPTPAKGACCKQGGKCAPDRSLWESDTWIALQFSVDDPHYYSFEYKVQGNAAASAQAPIDGSNNFTAFAYGDLDCDGEYSTFSMHGEVNEVYSDGPSGNAAMVRENELE